MTPSIQQLFGEADALQATAFPEQIISSDLAQYNFNITYCAERVLAASAPGLDEQQRWVVAREVAENYRSGETVLEAVRRWLPETWKDTIKRDAKGKMLSTPANAYALLNYHPATRGTIRFNLFTKQVEVIGGPFAGRKNIDSITTAAQDWIYAQEEATIPFTDLARRIMLIAEEMPFDPIEQYLRGLHWDHNSRIMSNGGWLRHYANVEAESPEYVLEVGRKFLLAAVSRAMEPGSKTDVVLVAEGEQGQKKSSMFEVLGGPFYADAAVALGDKDSKMLASAAWIIELPDMASFKRSEVNAMKAFFSTRIDTMRVPYGRGILAFPRRCVFTTTTNDQDYLSDPTGNRRYWPVRCKQIKLAELLRDRDQIWAEAAHIYFESESCGECATSTDTVWGQRPRCDSHKWWPSTTMSKIAAEEAAIRQEIDVWTPAIRDWAANPIIPDVTGLKRNEKLAEITTTNCLVYAVGKPLGQCSQSDNIRAGKILRQLGYESHKIHRGPRVYTKADPSKPKIAIV